MGYGYLAGVLQGTRKGLHSAETPLIVFGQSRHDDLLDFRRDLRHPLM